jgi:hypothetical protein
MDFPALCWPYPRVTGTVQAGRTRERAAACEYPSRRVLWRHSDRRIRGGDGMRTSRSQRRPTASAFTGMTHDQARSSSARCSASHRSTAGAICYASNSPEPERHRRAPPISRSPTAPTTEARPAAGDSTQSGRPQSLRYDRSAPTTTKRSPPAPTTHSSSPTSKSTTTSTAETPA